VADNGENIKTVAAQLMGRSDRQNSKSKNPASARLSF